MVSQILGGSFNLFLILMLIFFAKPLSFVILSFTISSILTAIVSLILAREKISTFDISYSKKLFISSIPLGLMLVFNLIYFRIDILLLSALKPNVDIGIYSIAYKFFDFFVAIPLFLSNSLYPKMLENINNKIGFLGIFKNYFRIYLLISFLIIIPVWFLSAMFGLIGPEFAKADIPFRILILSLPIFFITSLVQWILIAKGKLKFLLYAYLLSAVLNIILNAIFIPQFSYIASAVITLVSEAFILMLLLFKVWHSRILSEKQNGN
jgi:O-antigen/teichoic acid export membrane protein